MNRLERAVVVGALLHMAIYLPFFIFNTSVEEPVLEFDQLMKWHLSVMAWNFVALGFTLRDLYLRTFPHENTKLLWLIAIVNTGGIGWVAYLWKYATQPRQSNLDG